MPDYAMALISAVVVFLLGQASMFIVFLWKQSLMISLFKQSLENVEKTIGRMEDAQSDETQVIHNRITAQGQRISEHDRRLDEQGRQISHINGVLGVKLPH